MVNPIRNFQKNWKIAKTFNVLLRASVIITGVTIAEQALEIFSAPNVVHAEESSQQILPKQINGGYQYKYYLQIRKSLDLQKDFGNPTLALQTLDHLFSKIKEQIKPRSRYNKEEALELLKVIGGILKKEGNFEYRKNNLLIEGLKKQENGKRFIDCDDYSSLYLFASERLGLSLEPVYVPKHVFLLCRLNARTLFYWEPTLATEKDIGFYKNWLNIKEDSNYPKILNEKEFEAIQFCNLGVAWYEQGDYEKSIENSKKAITSNPQYAVAYNNLGVAYAKQGNLDKAIECYEKATNINPNYATAFSNTGVALYKLSYFDKAIKYFEKAIKADPIYDRAYNYKFIALMKKGERKKAIKFLNKIYYLKKKNLIHSRN